MKTSMNYLAVAAMAVTATGGIKADEAVVTAKSFGPGSVSVSSTSMQRTDTGNWFPTENPLHSIARGANIELSMNNQPSNWNPMLVPNCHTLGVTVEMAHVVVAGQHYDGLLVSDVIPGSIAQRTGIRQNDVILTVDNRPMTSVAELSGFVRSNAFRNGVQVILVRDGKRGKLSIRGLPNSYGAVTGTFGGKSVSVRSSVVNVGSFDRSSITCDEVISFLNSLDPSVRQEVTERLIAEANAVSEEQRNSPNEPVTDSDPTESEVQGDGVLPEPAERQDSQ